MNDTTRTIRLIVSGRVQGVGFRAFVAREAARRAIGGFARNLTSGAVEIVAQGAPDSIAALSEACGRGPIGSRVENVHVTEEERRPSYETFTIRADRDG